MPACSASLSFFRASRPGNKLSVVSSSSSSSYLFSPLLFPRFPWEEEFPPADLCRYRAEKEFGLESRGGGRRREEGAYQLCCAKVTPPHPYLPSSAIGIGGMVYRTKEISGRRRGGECKFRLSFRCYWEEGPRRRLEFKARHHLPPPAPPPKSER